MGAPINSGWPWQLRFTTFTCFLKLSLLFPHKASHIPMSPLCQHLFLIHCETTCGHIGSPSTRAKVSFSRALLCIIPRSISGFLFARHAQQHSAKAKTKGTRLILANVHTHQHEMETPASSPPLREHFYTQEEYTKRKAGWLQKVYKARLREQNKKDAEEVFGSNKTLKAKDIAQAELASQTIKCIPHTYTDGELIFLTAPITREEYEAKRLRVHGALQDVLAGHTANIHALIVFRGSVGELSVLEIRRREEEDVGVLGDSPGEITDLLPLPTEDMYEQDPLAFRAAAPAQPRKKGKGKAKVPDDGEPPHLAASQDHSGAGPTKAPLLCNAILHIGRRPGRMSRDQTFIHVVRRQMEQLLDAVIAGPEGAF
ncbi:hypothetical protein M8818_001254 [Zalaria obscura]|uniref:Uncharacterized protein n=1 Tax=Zalaria obscura TaxID=2024903 RepID=A0ACC3SLK6_9PEZI